MRGNKSTGRRVTVSEKVAFLSRPEIYPDGSTAVEVVETHMSWVFLSNRLAHKLKKPVHYAFLDYRSLESRRRSCREEVRLNRRLAAEVYIGAVPVTLDGTGRLTLDGEGETVDWLVRMNRLPAEHMLDYAILHGEPQPQDLTAVAALLAGFYGRAAASRCRFAEFRDRLAAAIVENRMELQAPEFDLPLDRIDFSCAALEAMLANRAALFEARLQAGCVVEGHGDLKPEHIYLGPEPAIIDCLEFSRDFRILDRVDELAYLALECERLGSAAAGNTILERCCALLGDDPPAELIDFYKAHRALLRARLAIAHLRDDDVREPGKWRPRAQEFLDLAVHYARRINVENA